MIYVSFYYHEKKVKGFVARGHAQYAPHGKDLVCAAVSALTQTAVLGLKEVLTTEPLVNIKETGYLACWLPKEITTGELEKAELLLTTLYLGLEAIKKNYGMYLQVEKRRWRPCLK